MKNILAKLLLLNIFCVGFVADAYAKCEIFNNKNNKDLLVILLSSKEQCPENVKQLKKILEVDGLVVNPTIVANRGYHNPRMGSFSIFESVEGNSKTLDKEILNEHFYFGHFTAKSQNSEISLDQDNVPGKLLIELIVFDFQKEVYNFYELIGTQTSPVWIYRGDSYDIYNDNKNLKIGKPKPSKLRCSACHTSGGPIMKELEFPHADWWTNKNELDFGNAVLSTDLKSYINQFIDAGEFAQNVKKGINLLEKTKLTNELNIKEKLKPLFCTTEINLKSDTVMFQSTSHQLMNIPSDIFINPLLVESYYLNMSKLDYSMVLFEVGMNFPENHSLDAQFGFHTPIKGYSDILKINKLIDSGFITKEFALDILSFDMEKPLFSKKRCSLLQLIPNSKNWLSQFKTNIKTTSNDKLSTALEMNNAHEHIYNAKKYLEIKEQSWTQLLNIKKEVIHLDHLRKSVFNDEISKNPRGQILEPGFRVVFPLIK